MLPWRNPWFQIAFFAFAFSGLLLIMDYAPKIQIARRGTQASKTDSGQPSGGSPTRPSPREKQAPAKPSAPLVTTTTSPHEEKSATKPPTLVQPPVSQTPVAPPIRTIVPPGPNRSIAQPTQSDAAASQRGSAGTWDSYEKAALKGDASAVNTIKNAANQGDVTAQYIVGKLYEKGEGVRADRNEAMKWYSLAAVQGNANATQALGRLRAH